MTQRLIAFIKHYRTLPHQEQTSARQQLNVMSLTMADFVPDPINPESLPPLAMLAQMDFLDDSDNLLAFLLRTISSLDSLRRSESSHIPLTTTLLSMGDPSVAELILKHPRTLAVAIALADMGVLALQNLMTQVSVFQTLLSRQRYEFLYLFLTNPCVINAIQISQLPLTLNIVACLKDNPFLNQHERDDILSRLQPLSSYLGRNIQYWALTQMAAALNVKPLPPTEIRRATLTDARMQAQEWIDNLSQTTGLVGRIYFRFFVQSSPVYNEMCAYLKQLEELIQALSEAESSNKLASPREPSPGSPYLVWTGHTPGSPPRKAVVPSAALFSMEP